MDTACIEILKHDQNSPDSSYPRPHTQFHPTANQPCPPPHWKFTAVSQTFPAVSPCPPTPLQRSRPQSRSSGGPTVSRPSIYARGSNSNSCTDSPYFVLTSIPETEGEVFAAFCRSWNEAKTHEWRLLQALREYVPSNDDIIAEYGYGLRFEWVSCPSSSLCGLLTCSQDQCCHHYGICFNLDRERLCMLKSPVPDAVALVGVRALLADTSTTLWMDDKLTASAREWVGPTPPQYEGNAAIPQFWWDPQRRGDICDLLHVGKDLPLVSDRTRLCGPSLTLLHREPSTATCARSRFRCTLPETSSAVSSTASARSWRRWRLPLGRWGLTLRMPSSSTLYR